MTRYRSGNLLYTILELSKVKITVAVAITTLAGYVLAARTYNTDFVLPTLGIFLLACGSSVINHLQERKTDALMSRTRSRPVPSQKITLIPALLIAFTETLAGSWLLYFFSGLEALLLGLIAMLWYNGIYAILKRYTPHAVVPGSVIGSIPPLVGWVSAGGSLNNIHAGILALFFFIWQVPHFYLLALKYGDEYQKAGLPSILSIWSTDKARKYVYLWIILTAIGAVLLASSGLPSSAISSAAIIACSIWLVISFRNIRRETDESFNAFQYFMKINYFVLVVTLMLMAGPLLYQSFHI
jgi:protoheme IX farnesyltransferase